MSNLTNTVRLHRVLRAPPERVYRAFLDPDAMVKWLPPHGFTGKVHHMDASVGGGYQMSFTNFGTGKSHSFGGKYIELKPHEQIRYTDRFGDPNMPGEMQVTIALRSVACGTELTIVQEGLPPSIPVEFCYLGWQESLSLLARLVEPEIPDVRSGLSAGRRSRFGPKPKRHGHIAGSPGLPDKRLQWTALARRRRTGTPGLGIDSVRESIA